VVTRFGRGREVGARLVSTIPHRTTLLTESRGKQTNLTSCPDNCVVIHDGSVILIANFVENREGQVYFIGRKFMNSENLYNLNGLDSKTLGKQIVNTLSNNLEFWQLNCISSKTIKFL
jgi:3'-phosphoadenosine 5'-phosphosulfate sulfotransferase